MRPLPPKASTDSSRMASNSSTSIVRTRTGRFVAEPRYHVRFGGNPGEARRGASILPWAR